MSKKLIATKAFYSYQGMDTDSRVISHGSGVMEIDDEELFAPLLKDAQNYNSKVVSVQVLSISPLEFIEVEDAK